LYFLGTAAMEFGFGHRRADKGSASDSCPRSSHAFISSPCSRLSNHIVHSLSYIHSPPSLHIVHSLDLEADRSLETHKRILNSRDLIPEHLMVAEDEDDVLGVVVCPVGAAPYHKLTARPASPPHPIRGLGALGLCGRFHGDDGDDGDDGHVRPWWACSKQISFFPWRERERREEIYSSSSSSSSSEKTTSSESSRASSSSVSSW